MKPSEFIDRINGLYLAFNQRNSASVVEQLSPDVRWPRAFEGDFVVGRDAVTAYWKHQWQEIDPNVQPVSIDQLDELTFDATIHQVVRDLEGNVLADDMVHHVYTFNDEGLISAMEVATPKIDLGLS